MTTIDNVTNLAAVPAAIAETDESPSLPGRIIASLGLSAGSLGFGLVAAAPRWFGLKATWAQYQRFSDFFIYALALGLAALMVAAFSYKRSAWKSVGFNGIVGAIVVAVLAVIVAVYAALGAMSVVFNA